MRKSLGAGDMAKINIWEINKIILYNMKKLANSINESIVNEGKVTVTTLESPQAVKYDLTPGFTDSGFPGIIIGKPFKYDDMKGEAAAMKLVKKFGLTVGNDYDFWIGDLEEEYGDDIKKMWFVYFLNNENYEVDCYTFPDGVCALM
jgi:hypothetical protein